jgi:hypothetical protein
MSTQTDLINYALATSLNPVTIKFGNCQMSRLEERVKEETYRSGGGSFLCAFDGRRVTDRMLGSYFSEEHVEGKAIEVLYARRRVRRWLEWLIWSGLAIFDPADKYSLHYHPAADPRLNPEYCDHYMRYSVRVELNARELVPGSGFMAPARFRVAELRAMSDASGYHNPPYLHHMVEEVLGPLDFAHGRDDMTARAPWVKVDEMRGTGYLELIGPNFSKPQEEQAIEALVQGYEVLGTVKAAIIFTMQRSTGAGWFKPLQIYPYCRGRRITSLSNHHKTGKREAAFGGVALTNNELLGKTTKESVSNDHAVFIYMGKDFDKFKQVFAREGGIFTGDLRTPEERASEQLHTSWLRAHNKGWDAEQAPAYLGHQYT